MTCWRCTSATPSRCRAWRRCWRRSAVTPGSTRPPAGCRSRAANGRARCWRAGGPRVTAGHAPRVAPATRRVSVAVDDGTRRLLEAVRALDHGGVAIEDLSLRRPTLDEVFLTLTGTSTAIDRKSTRLNSRH